MKISNASLATALSALLLASTSSWAVDPAHNGALNVPANRIVGLWITAAAVSPCGSGLPPAPLQNTILFNAGGTVVESPVIPPGGIPGASGVPGINQRGQALGTWYYNPVSKQYSVKLRFDWYVDGQYHGYQTVDRVISLTSNGNEAVGAVQSTRYAADGSTIVQVCGDAVSDRL